MLIEYLDGFARNYEKNRVDEAFCSIQRVLLDCEQKGVVPSIKDGIINNPNLKQETQTKFKAFYRARQYIEDRQRTGLRT